jgi:putative phage-type endonuclease
MALQQRTEAWREARRALITSTDIPVILGLSPYKSEATLAREKLEGSETVATLQMEIGTALEPVIQAEYERVTGTTLRRFHGIVKHPQIEWAAASPDWRRQGDRYLVEGKTSQSSRWSGEDVPQDVEAQVRWAMGCTGFPVSDVAALLHSRELRIYTVEHDDATFDGLVTIAEDFRRRLTVGGPFAEDAASIKAKYPVDDGSELVADAVLEEAVLELLRLRAQKADIEDACERIETAVKTRIGPATRLVGKGWTVTWKQTKDVTTTDWKSIADGLLRQMPETERTALVGIHSTVRAGFRPFRLVAGKEASE